MSFFTKNRIRNWLLIFLLVTNVATISTILYHSWQFRKIQSGDTHARLKKLIENDLKFSDGQNLKFKADKKSIEAKANEFDNKFEVQRIAVYNELSKKNIDTAIIDSIIIQTGIVSAEINRSSILTYYSLFKICNDQQKEKLSNFFKVMANDIANDMKNEKNGQCEDNDE